MPTSRWVTAMATLTTSTYATIPPMAWLSALRQFKQWWCRWTIWTRTAPQSQHLGTTKMSSISCGLGKLIAPLPFISKTGSSLLIVVRFISPKSTVYATLPSPTKKSNTSQGISPLTSSLHTRDVSLAPNSSGCAKLSANSLLSFIAYYKIPFAIAFILIGLLLCIIGKKFFSFILFLTGIFAVTGGIFFLFYVIILNDNAAYWIGWLLLAIGIVGGAILGCFLVKC